MKRGGPLRRKRKSNLPPRYRPTRAARIAALVRQEREFKEAARDQRVCQVCGAVDSWDAHHVIEKQYLKANGHPLYIAKNAFRICDRFSKNNCHDKHTKKVKGKQIKLRQLRDENILYAFGLLGPFAYDYLRRHYPGTDPRVEEALREYEAIDVGSATEL